MRKKNRNFAAVFLRGMPVFDGFERCEGIEKSKQTRRIYYETIFCFVLAKWLMLNVCGLVKNR